MEGVSNHPLLWLEIMSTIEQIAAETILEEPIEVVVGQQTMKVSKPSVATLIEVSRLVSTLPSMEKEDGGSALTFVLANARDCEVLGDICATLVLGKKHLVEERKTVRTRFFGLVREERIETIDRRRELAREILENMSGEEMVELVTNCLETHKIAFFLKLTISLDEANVLKRSRKGS